MKRTIEPSDGRWVSARLLAGLFAVSVWQAPQTARAEALGKIMPMGDSITLGEPVAGGYRAPLHTLLSIKGDTWTFAGSLTDNSTSALTAAGQAHHEGHSGYTIAGLDGGLAGWIGPGAESPDKILLMIGTNDIHGGNDLPNAPDRLNTLITHIYDNRPGVKLYVASITPMPGYEAGVQAFNAAIPSIVATHRALGRDVVYVPMYEAMNINTDLTDGVHPNALGYQHMAQAWYTALHPSDALSAMMISPANNHLFPHGASVSATAAVVNATGAYSVHIYTNSGSATFAEAGAGSSTSPYPVSLGKLPAGTYHIYATVADTLTTASTATNTFTVAPVLQAGQQILSLAGWNWDIIIGRNETAPGYNNTMVGWNFYETGLSGGTQGLPADSGDTPRTFTSSHNPSVRFQFAPYAENNAVYLAGVGSATLTLNSPAKFQSLQFLETTRTMSWYAQLNFADGSSTTTDVWGDPDWTWSGPADTCLTAYGLRGTGGNFYAAYLWMAERGVTLSTADQAKTLNSVTICTTSEGDHQLALFAVSGNVITPPLTLASPTNNQAFAASEDLFASASLDNAIGDYTLHVYTNSGSGTFAEAGTGSSVSPYQVSLGKLPVGTYHIYASATDTLATTNTTTNTFTVVMKTGQQPLSLSGWTQDIIIGANETAPGYNGTFADWNFYETGLSGTSQGLPADSGTSPRTFTSSYNPSVRFQFAPYAGNNAVYLQGTTSGTLTLLNPAKFYSLQFLETTRTMSWYAQLNFADGSSTNTTTWSDPDWTANPGPADRCLTSYGLKSTSGTIYNGYLWMAQRGFTLSASDRAKTLSSITFHTLGNGGQQLAVFAVSGYALVSLPDVIHAADVTIATEGPVGGSTYSVGWDFTASQTITVTALGQFDPDSNPQANTVAIYQRGGAKLAEATVAAASPAERCGAFLARYAKIDLLVLPPGDYVVFSTQNGDNFVASGGSASATLFGPAVVWNKGVALGPGSAAGPLPTTAPATWPIEDPHAWRYFGPSFTYKLGAFYPPGTSVILK